ncbi:MAG: glycosyltransferase [Cyclobacteriaceae bacterium]
MIYGIFIVFVVAISTQSIFWLLFVFTLSRHKNKKSIAMEGRGISVMICAYNELENLKILLPKLYNQDYDEFEVIIVNDRSSDGSYDFLLEEKKTHAHLKTVDIDRAPDHIDAKKYAITLGIKAAKFDHLLFTDADCYPESKKWISSMAKSFGEKTKFVLGYSQFKQEKGFVNSFSRFETQHTGMLYCTLAKLGRPYMGVGRNMAYTKEMFLENKGFNQYQKVTGGDDDLLVNEHAKGINTEVCIGQSTLVWSYSKKTFLEYFNQKRRHISVSKYYKFLDKFILGMYSLSHLLFWIAFVILAATKYFPELIFGLFACRLLLNTLIVHTTSKKFGERIVVWHVPIMDFIYNIYLMIMGLASLSTKKVTWK